MMAFYYLVKRNILLYFKDKTAVFFSLLSVMIVLLLMIVFLGDMNKTNLLQNLQELRGSKLAADESNIEQVVLMWTIAGILAVNSFTIPLTMIGLYVEDQQRNKLESFFTAPISRTTLLCGYLCASIITGMLMCILTLMLSFGYMVFQGYAFLSLFQIVQVLGVLLLCVSVSSAIILLISQFVHTSNAWGSLSTVGGTLIGFLGGIYLPVGSLPDAVQMVLKCFPFLHEAGMLRSIFTQNIIMDTFQGLPREAISNYEGVMGIKIELFDHVVPIPLQIACLLVCGIITLCMAIYKLRKHATFGR